MRQFTAVYPITRLAIANSYANASSKNARDFLINKVLKKTFSKVKSIQVGG